MLEFKVTVIFEGLILKLYKALGYSFHWLILTLSFYSKEEKDKIIEEDKSYHVWIGFILMILLIGLYFYLKNKT
ncbi:hypothetical protein [Faecalibacter macacae]|uniref:Uncharacterized protein n=1 Tax=Faecalibacter macacae TaxID=1859289 RepID=A0A3L9MFA8_9FLAO|nr:hypothetical protein [Faecalibacter macacae]RLZ11521.1 hypothetical protein EAH69_05630 [Faecalibacter macacae]